MRYALKVSLEFKGCEVAPSKVLSGFYRGILLATLSYTFADNCDVYPKINLECEWFEAITFKMVLY